jgi:RAQPRD family integrative conjugative element protein
VTNELKGLTTHRRGMLAAALAAGLIACLSSSASDESIERERLTAVLRELAAIERLIRESESAAPTSGTRYHFDYARLRADLARVQAGIEDYLTPRRAQPRDPQAREGDYRREPPAP